MTRRRPFFPAIDETIASSVVVRPTIRLGRSSVPTDVHSALHSTIPLFFGTLLLFGVNVRSLENVPTADVHVPGAAEIRLVVLVDVPR